MNRKSIIILSLVASLMFTGGCSASSPSALIKSPKILESQVKKEDISAIAKQFLPNKSKLVDVSKIATGKTVIKVDFDNDKKDEIIGFFDIPESFEKGFVVIKEKDGKWNKIYEYKSQGNNILKSEFIDLYGNGKKTLLFGNLISTLAGVNYNLFTFNDDEMNKVDLGSWNKMEILNTSLENDKKGFVFAGWRVCGPDKSYGIDLIRYDGRKFTYAKDLYPEYFKNVVKYYKDIMAKNSKDVTHWYYLADSQVKANMYNDAINSIKIGIDANNDKNGTFKFFTDTEFYVLKAQALNGLKKYDEAKNVLEDAAAKQLKKIEVNKKDKENKDSLEYSKEEVTLGDIYLELAKSCYKLKQDDKGMGYYQKYLDVISNLEKKEYFKNEIVKDHVELGEIK
ncbi:tetratricopeptide repeat protein [Clostridium sp.]|uniref:tetratricopeptide repeat protein n=1 Tax=Clostridium sp. TaxID=1506 RepID=UPI003D6D9D02